MIHLAVSPVVNASGESTLRLCVLCLSWAAALCVFAPLRAIFVVGGSTSRLCVFACPPMPWAAALRVFASLRDTLCHGRQHFASLRLCVTPYATGGSTLRRCVTTLSKKKANKPNKHINLFVNIIVPLSLERHKKLNFIPPKHLCKTNIIHFT